MFPTNIFAAHIRVVNQFEFESERIFCGVWPHVKGKAMLFCNLLQCMLHKACYVIAYISMLNVIAYKHYNLILFLY